MLQVFAWFVETRWSLGRSRPNATSVSNDGPAAAERMISGNQVLSIDRAFRNMKNTSTTE
jgi:hypothetical protein